MNGAPREKREVILVLSLAGACAGLLAGIVVWGWDYYTQSPSQRPSHVLHGLLRPSGRLGLILALVGTCLLVANLGYSIRKRLIHVQGLGSLRAWMAFHVWTGLVGGELILVHSAFRPQSALATLAVVALLITVLTGVIGRYIYAHVPRSLEGRELGLEEVRSRLEICRRRLADLGVDTDQLHIEGRPQARDHRTGILGNLLALITGDRQCHRDYLRIRREVLSSDRLAQEAGEILPLILTFCRQWQWFVRYHELRRLTASWRFLHVWFAVVMLMAASFHIVLAVRFGGLWILGGRP